MNIPGFTAEASLGPTAISYRRVPQGTAPRKRDHAATAGGRGLGGRPRRLGATQSAGGI
jgi:hypothetical protein